MTRPLLLPLLVLVLAGAVYLKAYLPLAAEREVFLYRQAVTSRDAAAAERHILKAVELDPGNTTFLFNAVQFYMLRDPGKALDLLERSIHHYNGDIVRWSQFYMKGLLKLQAGAVLEAREAFRKALWYNPEFKEAQVKLAEVEEIIKNHDKILIKYR